MTILAPAPVVATRRRNEAAAWRKDASGVFVPHVPIRHRDDEYDAQLFDVLLEMQRSHFWYRGRHRFLLRAVREHMQRNVAASAAPSAIDLGGGCGGWLQYLQQRRPEAFAELALADSSLRALQLAGDVVGPDVQRYQVDLLDLPWRNRWDVAFLLDVLEHIPGDVQAVSKIAKTLKPGGLLFITTPALKFFWSYNDELVHHVRRYARRDYVELAEGCGLEVCRTRYFMTLLSPLLLLSRLRGPDVRKMSRDDLVRHHRRTHRVPAAPINGLLSAIFALETPAGLWCPFPWGTSVLAVLRKPQGAE